ncbi:MAG: VCBS repeat-containing protein [Acidimicrobiales bacterium]
MRRKLWAVAVVLAVGATACYLPYDFDNDSKADLVAMSSSGVWRKGSDILWTGQSGDVPVAGDYDGNGVWEAAVVRGDDWVTAGSQGTIHFPKPPAISVPGASYPQPEILPVPSDYDGDGKTDPAWYRQADATWWIRGQADPVTFGAPFHTGTPDYDVAAPADFDGDGKADLATFSPATATWHVRGQADVVAGGIADIPVPADYDGVKGAERATFDFFLFDYHVAGRPDVHLDISWNDAPAGVLPAAANYDGAGGVEPAAFAYGTDRWYLAGQPVVRTNEAAAWPAAYPPAGEILRMTYLKRCLVNHAMTC